MLEHFRNPKRKSVSNKQSPLITSSPQLLATFNVFSVNGFAYSGHLLQMESSTMRTFVNGFSYLTCFQGLSCCSMYQHFISVCHQGTFHCTNILYCIHPFKSYHLSCFHLSATMNNVMNIHIHVLCTRF